jgi:hypothetical protein
VIKCTKISKRRDRKGLSASLARSIDLYVASGRHIMCSYLKIGKTHCLLDRSSRAVK